MVFWTDKRYIYTQLPFNWLILDLMCSTEQIVQYMLQTTSVPCLWAVATMITRAEQESYAMIWNLNHHTLIRSFHQLVNQPSTGERIRSPIAQGSLLNQPNSQWMMRSSSFSALQKHPRTSSAPTKPSPPKQGIHPERRTGGRRQHTSVSPIQLVPSEATP
jgi:hypothetical protein